jgi:hypothetical protein
MLAQEEQVNSVNSQVTFSRACEQAVFCVDCGDELFEDGVAGSPVDEQVCGKCERPLCEDCATDNDTTYDYGMSNGIFLCEECAAKSAVSK